MTNAARNGVDVIVVGAGPAGSAAASTLALHGINTLLVDRAAFPRSKVCGDGLTPRALAALERLGVWSRIMPYAMPVESIRTVDLRTNATWLGPLPRRLRSRAETGAVVRRDVLDHLLCQRAIEAGAVFNGGVVIDHLEEPQPGRCIVKGSVGGRPWRQECRAIVLAEGAGGRLAAAMGFPTARLQGIALRQYWRCPKITRTFTICVPIECDGKMHAGYGWIFPVSDEVANIGVGLYSTRDGAELRLAYRIFVERLKLISPEWEVAEPCGAAQGGSLQAGMAATELVRGRIVVAGDAAGVTNPFTGEGIAQALESGELAARSAINELVSPGCLADQVAARSRQVFPETIRLVEHLPWLAARSGPFVSEFLRAVSPPGALIAKAVRRIALEEDVRSDCKHNEPVERTWRSLMNALVEEYPLLSQLLRAVRHESEFCVDAPLLSFWRDYGRRQGTTEIELIAELLLLASLICVLGDDTASRMLADESRASCWAQNALTLGALDIVVARFFCDAARLDAAVSAQCANVLSQAIRYLFENDRPAYKSRNVPAAFRLLASGFNRIARNCVATAA